MAYKDYDDYYDEPEDLLGDSEFIDTNAVRSSLAGGSARKNSREYYEDTRSSRSSYSDAGYDDYEEPVRSSSHRTSERTGASSAARVTTARRNTAHGKTVKSTRGLSDADRGYSSRNSSKNSHSEHEPTRHNSKRTSDVGSHSRSAKKKTFGKFGRNGGHGGNGGHGASGRGISGGAKKKIIIAVCAVVAALIVVFVAGTVYYTKHFLPGTHIGYLDAGGMTPDEVKSAFSSAADDYSITVVTRGETDDLTATGADLGVSLNAELDFSDLLSEQSAFTWFIPASDSRVIEVENLATYDEAKFTSWYDGTGYFTNDDKVANDDSVPVYYDSEAKQYIAGGVQGNRLDLDKARTSVESAVKELLAELSLDDAGAYVDELLPAATAEETSLAENLNSYLTHTVTLDMGADTTEVIDGDVLSTCLTWDDSYNVTYDESVLTQYISDLEDKYDTVGSTREFTTHSGSTIEIEGGTYGWDMDADATLSAVKDALNGTETEVTIPTDTIFSQQGWTHDGPNGDIGDSYVEVDLTNQAIYCYVDGEQVLTSSCVSGDVSKNRLTPSGVYYIIYKQRDRTLRGDVQTDGTREYETLVHYWMCWTSGGVGFHDGYWRSAFGGTEYYVNGSHGCVNLPSEKAATLYDLTYENMPVVSYGGKQPSSLAITGIAIGSSTGEFVCERGGSITLTHETQGTVLVPSVKWTLSGQTSANTTISTYDGVLTVGADEQASAITATCTSEQDLTTQASVTVAIIDHYETPAETQAESESASESSES